MHAAPQVVAQQAGQAQQKDEHQIGGHRLATGDVPPVHPAGQDVLKHRGDRGQGGKEQEHEEQRPPQPPAGHGVEHVGQGDEDQIGAGVRIDSEGEGGGKDDQAGGEGHEGVQNAHVDGLAEQSPLPADVASKDSHGADAQAQGEEGLAHGVIDRPEQAEISFGVVHQVVEIGDQVEL